MKVALIFPPYVRDVPYPPLGLAYLASSLEAANHKVTIIDASVSNMSFVDVLNQLKRFNPDIIGVTTQTVFFQQVKILLHFIRKEFPEIPLVCGGPHATVLPEQTLKETCADIVVIGEGEITVVELIDAIEKGKSLDDIKGLMYKKGSRIIFTGNRKPIENLDNIPFPARHLLPLYKYSGDIFVKQLPYTSAIASRGCPFNCLFCTVRTIWGRGFRQRSVKNVISELYELTSKYKIKEIAWQDDNFTLNKKWVIDLCKEIQREKLEITWKCLSRVDTIDGEMLRLMKSAGCHTLWFGVESGNQEILRNIRKGIKLQQAEHALKLAKQHGFETMIFLMIGNYVVQEGLLL